MVCCLKLELVGLSYGQTDCFGQSGFHLTAPPLFLILTSKKKKRMLHSLVVLKGNQAYYP